MSNFQDFLDTLTPEQLRKLADAKEAESPPKNPKRKQSRKKLILTETPSTPTRKKSGPQRTKKKRGTLDKLLDKKGKPAKRLGSTPLGDRPNRFEQWEESKAHTDDIEVDAKLTKDRQPTIRFKPDRQPQFVDAVCSKCDDIFENVSINACYKDGAGFVFVCDDCIGGFRN